MKIEFFFLKLEQIDFIEKKTRLSIQIDITKDFNFLRIYTNFHLLLLMLVLSSDERLSDGRALPLDVE
jgi:hypothetical protein